jgi:hypothetical protein
MKTKDRTLIFFIGFSPEYFPILISIGYLLRKTWPLGLKIKTAGGINGRYEPFFSYQKHTL